MTYDADWWEKDQLRRARDIAQSDLDSARSEIYSLENELSAARGRIQDLEHDLEETEERCDHLANELEDARSTIASIDTDEERFSKF